MTLFCEGSETGVILDSGDGVTHCIPIAHSFLNLNYYLINYFIFL